MSATGSAGHRQARLASETDLAGFRRVARALLDEGVPPERVSWATPGERVLDWSAPEEELAASAEGLALPASPPPHEGHRVPASFVARCASVILHREPRRLDLLYRALWRLVHEPGLRHDALDADLLELAAMDREVRRDMHKMKAFVRFREVRVPGEEPLHVAWFEPSHRIVEAVAPFFARRFAGMRWAVLTPERSVRWDGRGADASSRAGLEFGPGARREDAPPPDAGEALWLTYYAHIFNPARLKLAMMTKEMPRRYWHNLPEARLIAPLAARSAARTEAMVEQAPTVALRRVPPRLPTAVGGIEAREPAPLEAATLDALRAAVERCRDCPIGEAATQAVFGEGPLGAALMVVGEQPGDQEDLRGRPFVGPAGALLDRALAELGWSRDSLYLTNAVKHFKFELRGTRRIHKTAGQREAAACLQWLEAEIARVRPNAFLALGATAARALLGRTVGVGAERGRWLDRPDGRPVLVTLHPSALLRMDAQERPSAYAAWLEDLRRAQEGPERASQPTR